MVQRMPGTFIENKFPYDKLPPKGLMHQPVIYKFLSSALHLCTGDHNPSQDLLFELCDRTCTQKKILLSKSVNVFRVIDLIYQETQNIKGFTFQVSLLCSKTRGKNEAYYIG